MVSTFYPPFNFGGDGMHIYRLSNELARRGHAVDVFHCEDAFLMLNRSRLPQGEFPNHPNVRVHRLKSRARFLSPLMTQQTGFSLFKRGLNQALENNDYDVIHYHNMSLIGISALAFGSPSAVKLYTTHEHWLICPMHVLWKLNREICLEKNCLACQLRGKRPPQWWRATGLLEKMLKHVDCFLSPSRFTLRKHLDEGLNIPIIQMPYFLPTPQRMQQENETSEQQRERPFFLFVGRLENIKGVQNLVQAFKEQTAFDLLVAGDGEYRETLEQRAKDCPNIKFLGRLDQQTLDGFYQKAIAVIVPSICYETFGIIIIEAFARRTPVIVNDLGALTEVVTDSDGGFVYRNETELVEAMKKLAEDKALRDRLGEKGFQAYLKYWNEEAHLEKYLALIEQLLTRKQKNALSAEATVENLCCTTSAASI